MRSKRVLLIIIPFVLYVGSIIGVCLFNKDVLFEEININSVTIYAFRYDRYFNNLQQAFNVDKFQFVKLFDKTYFDFSSFINGLKSIVNIVILIINLFVVLPMQFALYILNIIFSAFYISNMDRINNIMDYIQIDYIAM